MYAQANAWLEGRCSRSFPLSDAVVDAVEAIGITDSVYDTYNTDQAKDIVSSIRRVIWSDDVPFCGFAWDANSVIPIREQTGSVRPAPRYLPDPDTLPSAS